MLLAIREKVQGWLAWAIVIILIVPFALWGIDQYATGDRTVVIAEVNGEKVTATEFLQMYNRQRMRLQQQFGDMYDQVVEDEVLRNQVLDALIESQIIKQWAARKGLVISDAQLAAVIQNAGVFQENGRFSKRAYEELLMRNGLTIAGFEIEQRQFLLEQQYRNLTAGSMFVTESELEHLYQLQNQRRYIDYVRLDQRIFNDQIEISDQQKRDFYQANQDLFIVPEKVVVDYITFSMRDLVAYTEVSDAEKRDFYQLNIGLFTQPEMRRASHILIRGDEQAALEAFAEIQNQLAQGVTFAKLAEQYSQDPGSAANGGDLDFFEQGMMVPEFDQAVFSMEVDQVSDIVATDFGWHLIYLTDIREPQTLEFDQVEKDVAQQLRIEKAQAAYYGLLESVNTLAYEQPDSLEPLLDLVGGEVQTSAAFGREGGSSWFSQRRVLEAVFSDDVFSARLNSAVIELDSGTSMVLRVKDYKPEFLDSFESVEPQIATRLMREVAVARSAELADEVMAKIEAGADPANIELAGVEWHPVGWVERQSQQVLPQIVSAAFKAQKPLADQASWTRTQSLMGDTLLVRVSQVDVVDDEDRKAQMAELSQALTGIYITAEIDARLAVLRSEAKIDIKPAFNRLN
ncbi:SurA N-terminal domain-containing protein [Thiomicrospira sp. R3]|uniref:SurA N-terminal domain-containing protein n=1 Tax=Thiomicrospira sp. R3 TaxID=3035472 RepID=UPI00259BA2FE|nr:SurA N-terminal domain-containing protein [Thiomicrospira sp. R3]WFE67851.1 SurA N-terminal domain-containing protein [Thiomicrospira sp. R3]